MLQFIKILLKFYDNFQAQPSPCPRRSPRSHRRGRGARHGRGALRRNPDDLGSRQLALQLTPIGPKLFCFSSLSPFLFFLRGEA